MLYVLYGEERKMARKKLLALTRALQEKKPDAHFVKITCEEYTPHSADEYIGAQGLFERKGIIVFEHLLQEKDIKNEIIARLDAMHASENIFIFFEGEIEKGAFSALQKHADKIQEFKKSDAPVGGKQIFNVFSLTDAFGKRDKKAAWALFGKGIASGVSPEEIHALLLWQMKNIFLVSMANTAPEAGLSPFVFNKSKMFAKKYAQGELLAMMRELVLLYHNDRRGMRTLATGIERFLLAL